MSAKGSRKPFRACAFPGCGSDIHGSSKGLCQAHYAQQWKGRPLTAITRVRGRSAEQRIMDFVTPEPNTGCWLWTGAVDRLGYSIAVVGVDGRQKRAYRALYEIVVGPVPKGLVIDHLCRQRSCVNPAHMEPVTQRENVLRGMSPSAVALRENRCLRGHEFGPDTKVNKKGTRWCGTCARAWRAEYKEKVLSDPARLAAVKARERDRTRDRRLARLVASALEAAP